MKSIIHKYFFNKIIVNDNVSTISIKDIREFSIGKNFFYEIKNDNIISLHKKLNEIFSENIELNNASVAFRKKLSYLHLFEPHRKNYFFLRLDIRSFFHSIQIEDLREIFKSYISENEYIDKEKKQSLLDAFLNIVTYKIPNNSKNTKFRDKIVLPMGFKTSPIISNILFRQLDIQIQKLCSLRNIEYTRYADDMLFSSTIKSSYVHSNDFTKEIRIIIAQMKFKLNEHKTVKSKHTLSLNGYIIQYEKKESIKILFRKRYLSKTKKKIINEIRLSNKKTNIIKKMIHLIDKEKESADFILEKLFKYQIIWESKPNEDTYEKYNYEQLLHKILGYRSYLLSIVVFNKKYHCTQNDTINKYLKIVKDLENISKQYQKEIDILEEKIKNRQRIIE